MDYLPPTRPDIILPITKLPIQTGSHLYKNQNALDNPYQKSVDTYSGEDFDIVIEQAIAIADPLVSNCTKTQQD